MAGCELGERQQNRHDDAGPTNDRETAQGRAALVEDRREDEAGQRGGNGGEADPDHQAAEKAEPGSRQPSRAGTTRMWAVEEIGISSVIPWITPRNATLA